MNVNFGLFPPIEEKFKGKEKGRLKKKAITTRALADLDAWLGLKKAA
jgi:methylenetetrahydrofolate--tRNA-(uracil-5-)-methyltransferase